MYTQLTIKSGNQNFKHSSCLMSTSSMFYSIHVVLIKGTQESEMLTCSREDFLKLPLELQLCVLSVHLRGGQGKNTIHLGGIVKGKLQHGTSSLCFLRLDHHHHRSFPDRLCWICPSALGLCTGLKREGKITAFAFRAQRVG